MCVCVWAYLGMDLSNLTSRTTSHTNQEKFLHVHLRAFQNTSKGLTMGNRNQILQLMHPTSLAESENGAY